MLGVHELVMAVKDPAANVIALSGDGGVTWVDLTTALRLQSLPFFLFSTSQGVAWTLQWVLQYVPPFVSMRGTSELAWSMTGTTWHDVRLPTIRP